MNQDVIRTIVLYVSASTLAIGFMALAWKYHCSDSKRNTIIFSVKGFHFTKSVLMFILSFVVLFALIALKSDQVGADNSAYMRAYENLKNGTLTSQQDSWLGFGFKSIASVFAFLGLDYHVFAIAIGFLTLWLFYITIWRNSKSPAMSLFILISTCLYFQMFNQYRQMLAIGLVFFSINYIFRKRNIWKFLMVILLATSIHTTAIIFLPVYFVTRLKLSRNVLVAYVVLAVVCWMLYEPMVNILSNTYYGRTYFGSYLDIAFKTSAIVNTLVRVAMLLFVLITYAKKSCKDEKRMNVLIHIAIICTIMQILTLKSSLFGRLTTYFFVFYILTVPEFVVAFYAKNRLLKLFLILFFLGYGGIYYSSQNAIESGYQKYYFTFEQENKRGMSR